MILYINACVREDSRTRRLARRLLDRLGGPVEEARPLDLPLPKADGDFLKLRDSLLARGELDDPLFAPARQFAAADAVVVAAPYWDLSFPAALKQYLEQINVTGITFAYSPEGIPVGLCKARRLFYVTTAGGPILSDTYGFGYVRALAEGFYQIPETRMIRAEGLDLPGTDVEAALRAAECEIDTMF